MAPKNAKKKFTVVVNRLLFIPHVSGLFPSFPSPEPPLLSDAASGAKAEGEVRKGGNIQEEREGHGGSNK